MVLYLAGHSVDVDHTVPGQWPVSLRMQGVLYIARQCVVADGTVPGLAVCGCKRYCTWPSSIWLQTVLYLAWQCMVAV